LKYLTLVFLLTITLISVSAQDKVYPNMPFRVYRLNNGFVIGAELQIAEGPKVANDSVSGRFGGLTFLAGYQVARNFIASVGWGFSYYKRGVLVPLFLDFRYALSMHKISPYLYADGGLILNTHVFNTRTFINPGIGVQYSVSNDLALIFSSGFWLQRGDLDLNSFINFKAGIRYNF
jgi:hypothetical protein